MSVNQWGVTWGENAENIKERKTKQSNNTTCDKNDSTNNNEGDTQVVAVLNS